METFKDIKDKYLKKKKEVEEDAPTNNVGGGNIHGVGVGPSGEPGIRRSKYQKKNEKDTEDLQKMLKRYVNEGNDNNNVVLKGVLNKLDHIDKLIDEKTHGKTKLDIIDNLPEYKTFKDKYKV